MYIYLVSPPTLDKQNTVANGRAGRGCAVKLSRSTRHHLKVFSVRLQSRLGDQHTHVCMGRVQLHKMSEGKEMEDLCMGRVHPHKMSGSREMDDIRMYGESPATEMGT